MANNRNVNIALTLRVRITNGVNKGAFSVSVSHQCWHKTGFTVQRTLSTLVNCPQFTKYQHI